MAPSLRLSFFLAQIDFCSEEVRVRRIWNVGGKNKGESNFQDGSPTKFHVKQLYILSIEGYIDLFNSSQFHDVVVFLTMVSLLARRYHLQHIVKTKAISQPGYWWLVQQLGIFVILVMQTKLILNSSTLISILHRMMGWVTNNSGDVYW